MESHSLPALARQLARIVLRCLTPDDKLDIFLLWIYFHFGTDINIYITF